MIKTIRQFYKDNNTPKPILEQKLVKFEQNSDIASEFEYWIKSGRYKTIGAVKVEGYTAKELSEISEYLNGDGAFMMLIELRENPRKARGRIAEGFKRK